MQMSALQIVQRFTRSRGLAVPTSLTTNTDPQIVQMQEILEEEVCDLASRYQWQALQQSFTFTTVATQAQGYVDGSVPGATSPIIASSSGFLSIVNDTLWDTTRLLPLFGPRKMSDFAMMLAIPVTGPFLQYQIINNQMNILPVPTAGDTIIGYFNSRNGWTTSTGASTSEFIQNDSDVPLLDSTTVSLGLKWRWLAAKKLAYGEEKAGYELRVMDMIARDRPRAVKNLGGVVSGYFDPVVVIPAGSWPVQT